MVLLRECGRGLIVRYVLGFGAIAVVIFLAAVIESVRRFCAGKDGMKVFLERWGKYSILKRILLFFGNYSLELYLIHVTVRGIMKSIGYHTCRLRYEAVMVLISIALSVVLKKITLLIINNINRNIKDKELVR